jgi:hypothetical protein
MNETAAVLSPNPIDMQQFCANEIGKYLMTRPFVKDGWRYATNGHVCIRVRAAMAEDDQPGPEDGGALFPVVARIFDNPPCSYPCVWPVKADYIKEREACPQCCGKTYVGCEECGKQTCLVCEGRGEIEIDYAIRVGEHFIAAKYDRLIRTLANVVYYHSSPGKDGVTNPLAFKFDVGEGRVMGKRPPATQE